MIYSYRKAFSEVLYIIENLSEINRSKISKNFIEFLKKNKLEDYRVNFSSDILDHKEMLSKETKVVLALIYRDYFCSLSEKLEFDKTITENTRIYEERKKYNNIFSKNNDIIKKESNSGGKTELVKYKKIKWYKKLFLFINGLFSKSSNK